MRGSVEETFAVAQAGKIAHTVSIETIEYRLTLMSTARRRNWITSKKTLPPRGEGLEQ